MIAPQIRTSTDTPEWVLRADWSSKDALLAFWSAHPPALRAHNPFLQARAEAYTQNFCEQIARLRAQMHDVWEARKRLIDEWTDKCSKLKADDLHGRKYHQLSEEKKERLLALRSQMHMLRSDVRRAVRYIRAIEPKRVSEG